MEKYSFPMKKFIIGENIEQTEELSKCGNKIGQLQSNGIPIVIWFQNKQTRLQLRTEN